jgi:hypothetical protein
LIPVHNVDWQALYLDEQRKAQSLQRKVVVLEGLLARRHTLDPLEVERVLTNHDISEGAAAR